jgi:hypothetical protein
MNDRPPASSQPKAPWLRLRIDSIDSIGSIGSAWRASDTLASSGR